MKVPFDATRHLKTLNDSIARIEAHILAGKCEDFASYRAKVGERTGLLTARDSVKDTLNLNNDEGADDGS